MSATYTALATRDEGWWAVEVTEVPGLFTQSKRLDQIPDQVRDALLLFPEIEENPESATITVIPQGRASIVSEEVMRLRKQAEHATEVAQDALVEASLSLSDQGLSYRDIGQLLGISFQRAQQLATRR